MNHDYITGHAGSERPDPLALDVPARRPCASANLSSYYIRGSDASCLVRIYPTGNASIDAHLASDLAQELNILPGGTLLIYEVVEQAECFYDKLITEEEAIKLKSSDIMALVR